MQLLVGSAQVGHLAMLRIGGRFVSERSVELIAASDNVPALRLLILGIHTDKFRERQVQSDWTDPRGGTWDMTDYARRLEDKFGYLRGFTSTSCTAGFCRSIGCDHVSTDQDRMMSGNFQKSVT